jgi:hypothetical protein
MIYYSLNTTVFQDLVGVVLDLFGAKLRDTGDSEQRK